MKFFLLVALLYVLFVSIRSLYFIYISRGLVEKAVPFSVPKEGAKKILIIGDSLGVGVGASGPEHSIAGLVSKDLGYGVVNRSVSGDRLADGLKTARALGDERYDVIMIQLGANDILKCTPKSTALAQATELLNVAKAHAGKVIWATSGSIGRSPIFLPPVSNIYDIRSRSFIGAYEALAHRMDVAYINLLLDKKDDPFLKDPEFYYAQDKLHLADGGYAFWYSKIKPSLER